MATLNFMSSSYTTTPTSPLKNRPNFLTFSLVYWSFMLYAKIWPSCSALCKHSWGDYDNLLLMLSRGFIGRPVPCVSVPWQPHLLWIFPLSHYPIFLSWNSSPNLQYTSYLLVLNILLSYQLLFLSSFAQLLTLRQFFVFCETSNALFLSLWLCLLDPLLPFF